MNEASKKQKFVILYKYVSYKAFESIMEKWALKETYLYRMTNFCFLDTSFISHYYLVAIILAALFLESS